MGVSRGCVCRVYFCTGVFCGLKGGICTDVYYWCAVDDVGCVDRILGDAGLYVSSVGNVSYVGDAGGGCGVCGVRGVVWVVYVVWVV